MTSVILRIRTNFAYQMSWLESRQCKSKQSFRTLKVSLSFICSTICFALNPQPIYNFTHRPLCTCEIYGCLVPLLWQSKEIYECGQQYVCEFTRLVGNRRVMLISQGMKLRFCQSLAHHLPLEILVEDYLHVQHDTPKILLGDKTARRGEFSHTHTPPTCLTCCVI